MRPVRLAADRARVAAAAPSSEPRTTSAWVCRNDAAQDLGAHWWAGPVVVLALFAASVVLTACFFAWVPGRRAFRGVMEPRMEWAFRRAAVPAAPAAGERGQGAGHGAGIGPGTDTGTDTWTGTGTAIPAVSAVPAVPAGASAR